VQQRPDQCGRRAMVSSISQRVSYDNAPVQSSTPISTEPFGINVTTWMPICG
jgi:hypothetical protein